MKNLKPCQPTSLMYSSALFWALQSWHPCGGERRMSEWVRQSRICHYVLLASPPLSLFVPSSHENGDEKTGSQTLPPSFIHLWRHTCAENDMHACERWRGKNCIDFWWHKIGFRSLFIPFNANFMTIFVAVNFDHYNGDAAFWKQLSPVSFCRFGGVVISKRPRDHETMLGTQRHPGRTLHFYRAYRSMRTT